MKNINRRMATLCIAVLLQLGVAAAGVSAAEPVSVKSLLSEMTDYDTVARWPDPPYTCKQASSYDRASKTPDDPKNWFANHDQNQFIRIETNAGRTEKVMMDADGPGAIVRFWLTTGPTLKGALRIYLDGAEKPTILVPAYDFANNNALPAGRPLLTLHPGAAATARGGNTLYLPIPYARHCKVTWQEAKQGGGARYYQIDYRNYPAGTKVETFQPASYDDTNRRLANPVNDAGGKQFELDQSIPPGKQSTLSLPAGPAGIRVLQLHCGAANLRTLVLRAEFDGETTLWCPVGDFFGSGVGLNALDSWYRSVTTSGTLTCRWVMPFEKTGKLTLINLGQGAVKARLTARVGDWQWDDRSLHFHSNWRPQYPIDTRPMKDWNYLSVKGKGLYVGDLLTVWNPVTGWWGEGDEKIYVDGEKFPSHFGTGSEDYYNYSWGDPHLFQTPFANQVRCDGPRNYGYTVVTRTRSLDAIPFTKDLRFDIEVWHQRKCQVGYAATTYWYARPGATCNREQLPEEVVRELPRPKVMGAIEAESMKVIELTGGKVQTQEMGNFPGYWSDGRQLFWHGGDVGQKLTLELPVAKEGRYAVSARLTSAPDYGIVQFSLDGRPLGEPIDLYHETLTVKDPLPLGDAELSAGEHRLTLTITGRNPQARANGSIAGLDYLLLKPVRSRIPSRGTLVPRRDDAGATRL